MPEKLFLYDFIQLDEMEQLEAYWEGVSVGSCTKDSKEFEQTNRGFYVEYRIV